MLIIFKRNSDSQHPDMEDTFSKKRHSRLKLNSYVHIEIVIVMVFYIEPQELPL